MLKIKPSERITASQILDNTVFFQTLRRKPTKDVVTARTSNPGWKVHSPSNNSKTAKRKIRGQGDLGTTRAIQPQRVESKSISNTKSSATRQSTLPDRKGGSVNDTTDHKGLKLSTENSIPASSPNPSLLSLKKNVQGPKNRQKPQHHHKESMIIHSYEQPSTDTPESTGVSPSQVSSPPSREPPNKPVPLIPLGPGKVALPGMGLRLPGFEGGIPLKPSQIAAAHKDEVPEWMRKLQEKKQQVSNFRESDIEHDRHNIEERRKKEAEEERFRESERKQKEEEQKKRREAEQAERKQKEEEQKKTRRI
jgi:hypothetical protein